MITRKALWDSLNDDERFALLNRAELQRDNAVEYARLLSGKTAEENQLAERNRLVAIGRTVEDGTADVFTGGNRVNGGVPRFSPLAPVQNPS